MINKIITHHILQQLIMSWTGPTHILAFHSYLHAFSVVFVPYVELLGPSVVLGDGKIMGIKILNANQSGDKV